jgi:excisionase family DNA binding protein
MAGTQLLSPEQVAERLQVSRWTVMDYLRAGRIKGHKVGRLWRIKEQDLEAFIDSGAAEDRDDAQAAEDALANPERIPYEQVRRELGL